MKERTVYQKLEAYCEDVLSCKYCEEKQARNWAFGAIDFACNAGLITVEEFDELLEKYALE